MEAFSSLVKLTTAKVLLILATTQKWRIAQLDVDNIFLNGDMFEEVYIDLFLGYSR